MDVTQSTRDVLQQLGISKQRIHHCSTHGEQEVYDWKIAGAWRKSVCPVCLEQWQHEQVQQHERNLQREWAQEQQVKASEQILHSGIPPRFQNRRFSDYQVLSSAHHEAMQTLQKLAHFVGKGQTQQAQSLLLVGGTGTGKTHLACAAGMQLLEAGRSVVYCETEDMIQTIRDTWRSNDLSQTEVINRYGLCDLLILDEMGSHRGTPEDQSLIFRIINKRYMELLPTIIISNLPLRTHSGPDLEKLLGARVVRRLKEMATMVACHWPTYGERESS